MPNAKSNLRFFLLFLQAGAAALVGAAGVWLLWYGGGEGLSLLHDFGQSQGEAAVMALAFATVVYMPMVALGVLCLGIAWRTYRTLTRSDDDFFDDADA